jgi:ribonuclease D
MHYIQTTSDLQNLANRLMDQPRVALDTEFVWERTFYPILGLVQMALADGTCHLIDTVAVPDLSPLATMLADPKIEKILHDAPQDLMILTRASGAPARHVFDTRLAAGFAGLDSQTSLQNLLAVLLDVQLPKGQTRTDWTARPLSPEQVDYAIDDVRHMIRATDLLREKARAAGVEAWLDEELVELYDKAEYRDAPPENAYTRIRAAMFMPPRHLAALRELAAWRERTAREADLPRGFVATDHELVSVAQALPVTEAGLAACRQVDPRVARRRGPDLLAAVQRGLSLSETEWPKSMAQPDEQQVGKGRIQALQAVIRQKAEARLIDARMVATKADVIRLLVADSEAGARPEDHRLLRGWRAELLGPCNTTGATGALRGCGSAGETLDLRYEHRSFRFQGLGLFPK